MTGEDKTAAVMQQGTAAEQAACKAVYIHVDGAASGCPGPASVGVVLREVPGVVLAEVAEGIGQATNNEAEYHAVLRGIAEAKARGYSHVRLYSDSQLVVRQVRGQWACRDARLGRLGALVTERSGVFECFELVWVPRTQNKAADRLASGALDTLLGRAGRQDEFTFHNFQRLQQENQGLQQENERLRQGVQQLKDDNERH